MKIDHIHGYLVRLLVAAVLGSAGLAALPAALAAANEPAAPVILLPAGQPEAPDALPAAASAADPGAAPAARETDPWLAAANGTAATLPQGRWTIGIFSPLRIGLSRRIEISLHPLLMPLLPNISLKWAHGCRGPWQLASRHSFFDPTPLLRLLRRAGTGGIIAPEFNIPNMGAWSSEVVLTWSGANHHRLSTRAGMSVCLFRSSRLDHRTTIDLPLVFPRLQPFYHDLTWRGGLEGIGRLHGRWHYLVDADLFFTPRGEENWAVEHKGMLLWDRSSRMQAGVRYKLTWGEYPFGGQWHLLGPLVDLQWGWGGR